MKTIIKFCLSLVLLIGCNEDSPVSWKPSSSEHFINAEISGAIQLNYNADELSIVYTSDNNNSKLLRIESKSSKNGYLYNLILTTPIKATGKFTIGQDINLLFSYGIYGFYYRSGFVEIENISEETIKGNFEMIAYEWDIKQDSVFVKDSIKITNGSFSISR